MTETSRLPRKRPDEMEPDEARDRKGERPERSRRGEHRVREGGTDRSPALEDATAQDWLGSNQDPDVMLSVPDLGVDRISLNVEDLEADVELHAKVLDVVELHVGAKVKLGSVDLEIDNVHAAAMLKVKLDKVAEVVDRVLRTIDNNPEIVTSLTAPVGRGVEELGRGAGQGVRELGRSSDEQRPVETAHRAEYDEADRGDGRDLDRRERDRFDQDDFANDEEDRDEDDLDEPDHDDADRDNQDRARDRSREQEPRPRRGRPRISRRR